ncbi:hypothetical protein GY45DRAFT_1325785 [Cubamyces sp. BRFM 1775]|nr:hypothetical protein GY45DRAFT_1325785 [Cubamyces sp. BRFM 1775]
MSGIPPQLDTAQPGTPAGEWARSTTTAAFARTEPAPAVPTTTTSTSVEPTSAGVSISAANDAQKPPFDPKTYNVTPGTPGVPGAYPVTPGEQSAAPNIPISADNVKETAQSAAETATKLAQSAAETAAQYVPTGVFDTVSSYLPTTTATMRSARASEHDSEHTTSFPTREVTGAGTGERTGGVGSLPGPITESAVPKLPDERHESERYPTVAGAAAALAAGAYAVKDKIVGTVPPNAESAKEAAKETVQSTAQTVKQAVPGLHSTAVTSSTVPSRELLGAQPGDHSSGAGALPGFQDEPHVARLPEESAHPQYDSGSMDTAGQISLKPSEETTGNESAIGDARHVGGVGALIGGRDESSVALAPDERAGQMASGATGMASRTLPSQEPKGNEAYNAPKHVGGVGALVGGREEQGTAVLPDERTQQTGTGTGTVTQPKDQSKDQAAPQSTQDHKDKPSAQKSGHHGLPNKGPGYDTDYHPAKLHPPPEHITNPHNEGEKSLGATQADANRPAEEGRPPNQARGDSDASGGADERGQQKAKKAGFMEKMKGEAKVLLGKIEGKHEKVEEGQRMKAGEATSGKA